jgi:hypothetical protein
MDAKEQERRIDDFAIRCFRNLADQDYIHARLAYRHALHQQFLWSALQSLEKYFKTILLLDRISSKGVGHSLSLAREKLLNVSFEVQLHDRTKDFIEFIDRFGGDRYQVGSTFVHGAKLYELDSAVWDIRRYCIKMHDQSNIEQASKAIRYPYHLHRIPGGKLEEILENKKHAARSALVWQNAFYSHKFRKKVRQPTRFQATNAPLSLSPELIEFIQQYVTLPKRAIEAYREMARSKKN